MLDEAHLANKGLVLTVTLPAVDQATGAAPFPFGTLGAGGAITAAAHTILPAFETLVKPLTALIAAIESQLPGYPNILAVDDSFRLAPNLHVPISLLASIIPGKLARINRSQSPKHSLIGEK